MKVLVLGAAGYVGSVLCKKLISKNHEVVAADIGFFGFDGIDKSQHQIIIKNGFNLTEKDLEGCHCFINLAGLSNDPMADFNPELNFKLNTTLTEYTAELSKKLGIKYIFASSASIYDFGISDEEKDVVVDEKTVVDPVKNYSLSKFKAENILLGLADRSFSPIILRKSTICGYSPRMRYDLVLNTFIKDALRNKKIKLHGGGENWRPLIDVNDVCEVYSRCLELKEGGIYNMIGYNIRISELALRISSFLKSLGYELDIECDYSFPASSMRSYRVNGTKLHKALDFVPQIGIEDSAEEVLRNISKIDDFDNPIYYNITWVKKYLQHWMK